MPVAIPSMAMADTSNHISYGSYGWTQSYEQIRTVGYKPLLDILLPTLIVYHDQTYKWSLSVSLLMN